MCLFPVCKWLGFYLCMRNSPKTDAIQGSDLQTYDAVIVWKGSLYWTNTFAFGVVWTVFADALHFADISFFKHISCIWLQTCFLMVTLYFQFSCFHNNGRGIFVTHCTVFLHDFLELCICVCFLVESHGSFTHSNWLIISIYKIWWKKKEAVLREHQVIQWSAWPMG